MANPVTSWSDEKKANVRARYAEGWSAPDLARKLGVTVTQIEGLVAKTECALTRQEKLTMAIRKKRHTLLRVQGPITHFAETAHQIDD